MGVHGLGEYIKKKCPKAIRKVENGLEQFRGQRMVFDTSGTMYKFVATCESLDDNDHLKSFVNLYTHLQSFGIEACFVFDGKQTFAKMEENKKRAETRKKTQTRAQENIQSIKDDIELLTAEKATDMESMVKMAMLRGQLVQQEDKSVRVVKSSYYAQLQTIFEQHHIPYVVAHYEAEQVCAWLVKHGYADIVIADDYDCLPCGAPTFLQHFTTSLEKARFIDLPPLLEHLKMTHSEFVDFCILLGTDFGGKLRGIGPVKACGIIQQWKSIEAFLESEDGQNYHTTFNYEVPRIMFMDDSFPVTRHSNLGAPFESLLKRAQEVLPKERFSNLGDQSEAESSEQELLPPPSATKRRRIVNL